MLHSLRPRFAMPYRRTENVVRKLAARHDAIMAAAREIATEGGMAALVAALAERERAVLEAAAKAAPGPLSALAAAITTFAARALAQRQLAFALMCEPV